MYPIVYRRKKFIENQFSQIDGRKGQPNGGDDEQGNPREREREREGGGVLEIQQREFPNYEIGIWNRF